MVARWHDFYFKGILIKEPGQKTFSIPNQSYCPFIEFKGLTADYFLLYLLIRPWRDHPYYIYYTWN